MMRVARAVLSPYYWIEDHSRVRTVIELTGYVMMITAFALLTGEVPAALGAVYVATTYALCAARRMSEEL